MSAKKQYIIRDPYTENEKLPYGRHNLLLGGPAYKEKDGVENLQEHE